MFTQQFRWCRMYLKLAISKQRSAFCKEASIVPGSKNRNIGHDTNAPDPNSEASLHPTLLPWTTCCPSVALRLSSPKLWKSNCSSACIWNPVTGLLTISRHIKGNNVITHSIMYTPWAKPLFLASLLSPLRCCFLQLCTWPFIHWPPRDTTRKAAHLPREAVRLTGRVMNTQPGSDRHKEWLSRPAMCSHRWATGGPRSSPYALRDSHTICTCSLPEKLLSRPRSSLSSPVMPPQPLRGRGWSSFFNCVPPQSGPPLWSWVMWAQKLWA